MTAPTTFNSPTRLLDAESSGPPRGSLFGTIGTLAIHGLLFGSAAMAGAPDTKHVYSARSEQFIVVELPPSERALEQPLPKEDKQTEIKQEALPTPTRREPTPTSVSRSSAKETRKSALHESVSNVKDSPHSETAQAVTTPDELLDFGDTIITGSGASYAGGVSETHGANRTASHYRNVRGHGVRGTDSSQRQTDVASRASKPRLSGGSRWNCPFPREAEFTDQNSALVALEVQISPKGKVLNIQVTSDPGYGFAREAKRCAQRKKWFPGLDRSGDAIRSVARVRVRFQR